jgi:NAD(P)-dependent dehydrogenase (short-subunit alcohol dehydrogenase family)
MRRMEGKVALVTGAASGIGRAIALVLGGEGACVVVADIDINGAEKVAGEIRTLGGISLAAKVDISKEADAKAAVERSIKEFGKVDVLVNNAAYLGFSLEHKLFMDTDEEEWDKHLNVTIKGTLRCCKAVIPYMKKQGGGRIINITSDSAKTMPPKGETVYGASKSAIAGFSRCLAGELARDNILVNCVAPGFTMTPAVRATRPQKWIDSVSAAIPLRKPGEPEDIATMVLFLASDEAKYITGQHFSVNGGLTMY